MSFASISKSKTSAFASILLGVSLFGSGTQSFCKQYRMRTCAYVFLYFSATDRSVLSSAFRLRTSGQ